MLHDQPIRYLARLFVQLPVLPAERWDVLAERLRTASGWVDINLLQVQRLSGRNVTTGVAFQPADQRWNLTVATDSFDLTWTPRRGDTFAFSDFIAGARQILPPLLTHFSVRANRLASIREGFVDEAIRPTEGLPDDLLVFPDLLADGDATEWTWRCVSRVQIRVGEKEEALNRVVTIQRLQGQWASGEPFDRVRADLDVNTVHSNTAPRFEPGEADLFLAESVGRLEAMERSVEELVRKRGES